MIEKPFKNQFDKIAKYFRNHPKTSWSVFIFLLILIGIKFLSPSLLDNFFINLFHSCSIEQTEKETTENWLRENFTDTTYNVLILPFNNYQENSKQKLQIERAIEGRIDELRDKFFSTSKLKTLIKLKCYLDIPEFLSIDSIKNIGKKFNADFIIYGDIYSLFDKQTKRTNVKYIILTKSKKELPFRRLGETGLIEFSSLDEIREGYLIKDIDYMTLWILCNEEIYYNKTERAILIWDSIEKNFQEKVFSKTNAYMCAIIGESCYHNNDFIKSKIFFKKATEYYHNFADAFNNLGLVYTNISNYDSAKICYYKAIKINPKSSNAYNNLGILYLEKLHSYDKAKKYFKKSYELDPSNGNVVFNLGLLFARYLKNPDSAKVYFLRALNLLPDSSSSILKSVGNSFSSSNFDTALLYYKKALNKNPKSQLIYYDLGVLYYNFQKYQLAKSNLLISIKLSPKFSQAYNYLGLIYMNGYQLYDSAKLNFSLAIKYDSSNEAAYYFNLGVLYSNHYKDYGLAKKYFYKSISISPNYSDAFLKLGNIYSEYYKNYDSARYCYEKTITLDSRNSEAFNNYAIILRWNFKEYELSEKYFKRAIELDPKLAAAHFNYSMLLLNEIKNLSKAKQEYLTAIRFDKKFQNQKLDEYFAKIR